MLYLLDANVLIDANRDYYPIKRVPEFWEWLVHVGTKGFVKISQEIFEEIKPGRQDDLTNWVKTDEVRTALLLGEEADVSLVSLVMDKGYAPDLSDEEVEKIGQDPFLIAYALVDLHERCVVTTEVSKPNKQRANRHMPDVCNVLDVKCCNTFELLRVLDFKTNWKAP